MKSKVISDFLDRMEDSYRSCGFGFHGGTIENRDENIIIKYDQKKNYHYLYKPYLIKIVGKNKKRLNKILKDGLGWRKE